MRLGGAGCRAGAGGTLDRPKVEPPGFCEAFKSRQNVTCGAHVAGFFLNPDNLAGVRMLIDGGGNFRSRERVELVEKENGGTPVLVLGARSAGDTAAAFCTQLLAALFACGPAA